MTDNTNQNNFNYSSASLYEFIPDNTIDSNNIVELTKIIRVGISGDLFKKLSPELQKHFKEVT